MAFEIRETGITDDGFPYLFRFAFNGSSFEVWTGQNPFRNSRTFNLQEKLPAQARELQRYLEEYAKYREGE